ncbi:predicted protein [Nematostella vectensis]|uniref:allantoinase n=1 Tax=Nematostella vectensis TaxID=45351 RepID=A7RH45_NEMVE|nr:predicted protein [Nematostella vectensis]|eukprot:XP_001641221.1 predicted protein [Nematostella vectensis]
MPGVVDSHVHINQPGRTQWEGFETATQAAASGGITTLVDMPLNSIPPTTTVQGLKAKMQSAQGKCWVDVAFWGGVIPGNQDELQDMIRMGVRGFKCFLIHSGVEEFPHVSEAGVCTALEKMRGFGSVLLFHAEVDEGIPVPKDDKQKYDTFLKTRPESMENKAIEMVIHLCDHYRVPCHIVHLSSGSALDSIRSARSSGIPLTVETTHHYLSLTAEEVPDGATQYKCCPPIRDRSNQEVLWNAVKFRDIDLVVSDHSPCTPDLKLLDQGDFIGAWGGISSLQYGLSLFWSGARCRGLGLHDVVRVLCEQPSKLCSLQHRKGMISVGKDADFVIWDPNEEFMVKSSDIRHRNKVTPYAGKKLFGRVHQTILRGQVVFSGNTVHEEPLGDFLLDGTQPR